MVTAVPYKNIDNIAPAGSINSSAMDMAQWVRLMLGGGKYGGKPLISTGNFTQLHTPHTVIRLEPPTFFGWPEAHLMSYGLGWFLNDYKGRLAVPSPFRRRLGAEETGDAASGAPVNLVLTISDQCLAAYPMPEWEQKLAIIAGLVIVYAGLPSVQASFVDSLDSAFDLLRALLRTGE